MFSIIPTGIEHFNIKNYLPTANVEGTDFVEGNDITYKNRESRANMQPSLNSVWFAKMKNSIKHLYISETANFFVKKYILSTGFFGLQCSNISFAYVASYIDNILFENQKNLLAHGATQESVNENDLSLIKIYVPSTKELTRYNEIVSPMFKKLNEIQEENLKLTALRNEILPMLLNGQVSIR